jgi:hypothetical protein
MASSRKRKAYFSSSRLEQRVVAGTINAINSYVLLGEFKPETMVETQ